MGREILQRPDVLVVSQPTWGVDAGAAAAIRQALVDLAAAGSAIVVISQDLDELLELCDTLAVINGGRLSRAMKVSEADINEIGLLMGGIHGDAGRDAGRAGRRSCATMRLKLEKRAEPSRLMLYATPVGAVLLTMIVGAIIFSIIGYNGLGAVYQVFIAPLTLSYKWQDIAVKASPLILIGVGLAVGNRAAIWNIGAEGQYIVGALGGRRRRHPDAAT